MEVATPNAQRSTLNVQLPLRPHSPHRLQSRSRSVSDDERERELAQIENRSRTSADTRTGRPVCAFIGHQSVRAADKSRPSLLLRISVNRSNVSRVALPTHVRNKTSSSKPAAVL